MLDAAEEIRSRLDAIDASVQECRAALDIVDDGDPTAAEELRTEVDVMAEHVAALKNAATPPTLG